MSDSKQLNQKQIAATEQNKSGAGDLEKELKFCTACQARREVTGGVMKRGKNFARWMCKECSERKTDSIYRNRSGNPVDVKTLMEKLYKRAT